MAIFYFNKKTTRTAENSRKEYQYISEGSQKIQINERTKAEGESVNGANQQILCGSGEDQNIAN